MTKRQRGIRLALGLTAFINSIRLNSGTEWGMQRYAFHDTSGTYRYKTVDDIRKHRTQIIRSLK